MFQTTPVSSDAPTAQLIDGIWGMGAGGSSHLLNQSETRFLYTGGKPVTSSNTSGYSLAIGIAANSSLDKSCEYK